MVQTRSAASPGQTWNPRCLRIRSDSDAQSDTWDKYQHATLRIILRKAAHSSFITICATHCPPLRGAQTVGSVGAPLSGPPSPLARSR